MPRVTVLLPHERSAICALVLCQVILFFGHLRRLAQKTYSLLHSNDDPTLKRMHALLFRDQETHWNSYDELALQLRSIKKTNLSSSSENEHIRVILKSTAYSDTA